MKSKSGGMDARRAASVYHVQPEGTVIYTKLNDTEMLTGADVLPGFSTPVSAVFPFVEPTQT